MYMIHVVHTHGSLFMYIYIYVYMYILYEASYMHMHYYDLFFECCSLGKGGCTEVHQAMSYQMQILIKTSNLPSFTSTYDLRRPLRRQSGKWRAHNPYLIFENYNWNLISTLDLYFELSTCIDRSRTEPRQNTSNKRKIKRLIFFWGFLILRQRFIVFILHFSARIPPRVGDRLCEFRGGRGGVAPPP